MKLSLIAAIGRNNELGKNNDLIWHLKEDLKFFKETTMNKTIIMGYNTYESLPKRLPGRKYIVLSRRNPQLADDIKVYPSKEAMLEDVKNVDEEMFVIGGASIYQQFIDLCQKMYLTEIDAESEADVYFPHFDKNDFECEVLDEHWENGISYKHLVYRRK